MIEYNQVREHQLEESLSRPKPAQTPHERLSKSLQLLHPE
jgi:hypothetical protein